MGTIISKYKCTHRAEEYFTVNKKQKQKQNEMLSFPRELFLFLKRGPNSVLLVLDWVKWREHEHQLREWHPALQSMKQNSH